MDQVVEIRVRGSDAKVLVDARDATSVSGTWQLSVPGGYATAMHGSRMEQRRVYMHRLIMGLKPGDGRTVDHINRNRLDNRRCNLRVVTPAENFQNVGPRGGSSKHRGVSWNRQKQKWVANVKLNQRAYHLGCFAREEEAASAALEFRRRHMPFATG